MSSDVARVCPARVTHISSSGSIRPTVVPVLFSRLLCPDSGSLWYRVVQFLLSECVVAACAGPGPACRVTWNRGLVRNPGHRYCHLIRVDALLAIARSVEELQAWEAVELIR